MKPSLLSSLLLAALVCAGASPPARAAADVSAVQATGAPGAYTFAVTVRSPDKGCNQYADWWEVLSADGRLLYRRVLLHSHVDEQPFSRSGGPVAIKAGDTVYVRAHMSTTGYGGAVFKGSPAGGFARDPAPPSLPDHSRTPPLPDVCAF
ncbi:MAG: hypothetical protein ACOZDY_15285 [Pseudomonadota bacterium]